jgi:phage portal protein BeeE
LWERVTKAPFLTKNEKREATGYAPVEGGDAFG